MAELLDRKASDRATPEPERDALRAKAAELRGASPPLPPQAPPRAPAGAAEPPRRRVFVTTATTASSNAASVHWTFLS